MSKTNEVESIELSARDLGKVLGLTDRQVRNLADAGIVIPGDGRGKYRLHPSVQRYTAHLASRETPASVRLDEERARGQRLLNDQREGRLIPLELADTQMQEIVGLFVGHLNGLPVMIVGNRRDRAKIAHIEAAIDRMKSAMVADIAKLQAAFEAELAKRAVRSA